jgi:cytochrome c biogenesis protein CcdA
VAWLRVAIGWTSIGALVVLGLLSLLDAWRYGRTGDSQAVLLQLPCGIKRLVHRVARTQMRGHTAIWAGLACGAAVTALESVCTGQMYLPTLVLMSRESGGGRTWGLLLLYNLMFVMPLLVVFGLAALGVRSRRLSDWTRLHVVPAKILLALVFLLLAALFAATLT